MSKTPEEGKRFTHLYAVPTQPRIDSVVMRRRLGNFFENKIEDYNGTQLKEFFREELGAEPRILTVRKGSKVYCWGELFLSLSLEQFLDAITLICQFFEQRIKETDEKYIRTPLEVRNLLWKGFVIRVFKEEKASYTIDGKGGIHFLYDAEFERNSNATIGYLNHSPFAAVLKEYQRGLEALREQTPDTKTSVLSIFDAAETLFKLLFEDKKVSTLTPSTLKKLFLPIIQVRYSEHQRALESSNQILGSFCKWVDSIQQYRHGQKDKQHSPPPLELTVLLVSQGASFIRWMLEITQK